MYLPLDELLGRSFSGVFPNVDEKWLKSYKRAALFGRTLEIIDFLPEIDTYLNIICFCRGRERTKARNHYEKKTPIHSAVTAA